MYAALQVEKDEVDELIKTMSEKNRQLLLAIKRLEQDIISKTESIDKMTVDLENKSTEIEGLRQQEATLKNKLSEADSKLQVTIQRANATMMQFKDRNKSLFEERKSLEYQLLLMKEKINALQAEGQQSTAEQRADTEIESGPVAPQVLRDVNDTPPPDTTVKTEDLSDAAVPPPQHNLSVREEQRHPVTSDLQTFTTPSRLEAQSSGSLDAHSSTQTAKMALDETAPAPETGQEATAVKQRRTKADLDNLRMKYESLLSQIESSKMSGKLQKSPFSPGVPNTGQDMNRSHLRRSEAFPELTQPIHHHEKGVSSAPVLSGSSDMQVVTDSDEFSANKKFKSALHGSNTSYTHPSVHISRQPPQDFGQSSHSSSVEPPFPIQDTSTHYFEPPEPGEISEFDTVNPQKPPLYVTQGPAVASATRLVDKPLHISSQFSSGQDLPANATRPDSTFLQPGRDSTTARITSLPHKTAPNPDSSRMTQIAKTGPTLTPDQRSQLLKRKLEAAEAKIATPSISTHVGTTSSEDNTQTDTGHNKNNHEST